MIGIKALKNIVIKWINVTSLIIVVNTMISIIKTTILIIAINWVAFNFLLSEELQHFLTK
ncbi:hypothetical protein ATY38_07840 [Nitrosomonas ureae]|nr:hypothetical protein ATY38_07840 [Nitrosomonas ureae]